MRFKGLFKKFLTYLKWSHIYIRFILKDNKRYFNIFTHMTKIERLFLYKIARSLRENATIVEIGSYLGASASFLACAAKEKNHKVYCVDTWKNEGMSEGERDTFDKFCENIKPLKDYVHILKGKSVDTVKTFNKKIDLLLIDGDHSYDAVKIDVESWLPRVRDSGIVIFHDIGWAEGVKRIVNEYIKPIAIEEHIVDYNIYWARVKKIG